MPFFTKIYVVSLLLCLTWPFHCIGQGKPTIDIDSIVYYGNYTPSGKTIYYLDTLISTFAVKSAEIYFHGNHIDTTAKWFYQTDYQLKWFPVGNQNWLIYDNLLSGDNKICLSAKTPDGKTIISHTINIFTPMPFWKNWWFPMVFAAFLFLFGSTMVMIFYGQKIKQEKRMNEMRQRIAYDLHDEIGATLGSVALLGEWTKKKIDKSAPDIAPIINPKLESLVNQTRNILDELRIVIWAVNPHTKEGSYLLDKTKAFAAELLEPNDIKFKLISDDKVKTLILLPLENQQLVSFMRECFHNVLKHSKANTVTTQILYKSGNLTLIIEDNGIGFETTGSFQGFGLKSLHDRVQKLEGKLDIFSQPNQGTQIKVVIELGKNP
jgi:hypothetical protein